MTSDPPADPPVDPEPFAPDTGTAPVDGARGDEYTDDGVDDVTRTVRLRRRGEQARDAAPHEDEGALDEIDADDGSTMVVRRESKRRAEAAAAVGADDELDVTALSRSRTRSEKPAALWPTPSEPREEPPLTYPPRTPDPVIVPRAPAEPHERQRPVDTAAIEVSRLRRARRRLTGAVVAASVIAVAAITGLVLLLTAF